jgi:hypothetical protein
MCSVEFKSQEFRPTNGRVTVLAYAQGIEDFTSQKGTSQYYCVAPVDVAGNPVSQTAYRPLVDICPKNAGNDEFTDQADAFLDAGTLIVTTGNQHPIGNQPLPGTLDGVYQFANGDLPIPYNHVDYSSVGDKKWGLNYIRRFQEFTFSGSEAILTLLDCSGTHCVDLPYSSIIAGVAGTGCSSRPLNFRLTDVNNNPMPANTTVTSGDADKLSLSEISGAPIASTSHVGGTQHGVMVKADSTCAQGFVTIKVTTPRGIISSFVFSS